MARHAPGLVDAEGLVTLEDAREMRNLPGIFALPSLKRSCSMQRRTVLFGMLGMALVSCGATQPAPLQGPALVFFYTEQ